MQRRLGALMEAPSASCSAKRPALDWREQVNIAGSPIYRSVPPRPVRTSTFRPADHAGSQADLRRAHAAIDGGADPPPVLIVYDDSQHCVRRHRSSICCLQARQARAPLLVATQFLPEDVPIRRPLLSAGVLIVHRLEAETPNWWPSSSGRTPVRCSPPRSTTRRARARRGRSAGSRSSTITERAEVLPGSLLQGVKPQGALRIYRTS